MRIPHTALPAIRTVGVLLFGALCLVIFGYLWVNSGGKIPLVSRAGYQVNVTLPDVDNLVYQSDVRMAGVDVGKVEGVTVAGSQAHVTLQFDSQAPLHRGATVTVRNKTLLEETYLEVTDGQGPEIPSGETLPGPAGRPSVQLNDVLTSLDAPTRQSLGHVVRSSSTATAGSKEDLGRTLEGLGDLGRQGGDALSALAAQSDSLKEVTGNTTALLRALDTRQGRVTQLVTDSDALTNTVAANRRDVEGVMRQLPPVLDTARTASQDLHRLSGSLAPVAANLAAAAPDLTTALRELPATSQDLRGLLPSLNQTLDRAPGTLDRVPPFSKQARPLLSTLHADLGDVNPMLGYLQPYGHDLAAFFTNFQQYLGGSDANGQIGRVLPIFNEKSPNTPLNTQTGPLNKHAPYPAPGASTNPGSSDRNPPPVAKEPPRQ